MNQPKKMISDAAVQLTELNAKLFESTTSLCTKLSVIKEEVNSGQYQMNPDRIATKLIEFNQRSVSSTIADSHTLTA